MSFKFDFDTLKNAKISKEEAKKIANQYKQDVNREQDADSAFIPVYIDKDGNYRKLFTDEVIGRCQKRKLQPKLK